MLDSTTLDCVFFMMLRPPPISTLFPYTTLFRSAELVAIEMKRSLEVSAVDDRKGIHRRRRRRYGATGSGDRKSTRLNSSHEWISYAVFCLKKKKQVRDRSAKVNGKHR